MNLHEQMMEYMDNSIKKVLDYRLNKPDPEEADEMSSEILKAFDGLWGDKSKNDPEMLDEAAMRLKVNIVDSLFNHGYDAMPVGEVVKTYNEILMAYANMNLPV